MKFCSKCGKEKEETIDNFYHTEKNGFDYYCITCRRKINLINYNKRMARRPVETERTCKTCKETYPLTNEYFHYKHIEKNYFSNNCKDCRNAENKAKSHKRKDTRDYITRSRVGEVQEYTPEQKKKIEEQYNKMLIDGIREDRKKGLKLDDLKLKVGQVYKIKQIERNITETFEGKLIQICDKHLVFRGKNGRCESFLKVDLLLEHEYKEVN